MASSNESGPLEGSTGEDQQPALVVGACASSEGGVVDKAAVVVEEVVDVVEEDVVDEEVVVDVAAGTRWSPDVFSVVDAQAVTVIKTPIPRRSRGLIAAR